MLRVVLVERGGGLIEDEQPDVLVECLRDLDELLLADADVLDRGLGLVVEADVREELACLAVGLDPVDDTALDVLVAQEDVLRDAQLRDEGELLVDDDDPGMFGLPDVLELDRLAVVDDLAGIAPVRPHPRQYFHEGRFACTVLSADGMHLAPADHHGYVLKGLDPGELLGDVAHLEDDV